MSPVLCEKLLLPHEVMIALGRCALLFGSFDLGYPVCVSHFQIDGSLVPFIVKDNTPFRGGVANAALPFF